MLLLLSNKVETNKVDFELKSHAFEFHQLKNEAKQRAYKDFIEQELFDGLYLFDNKMTKDNCDFDVFVRYFADSYIYEADGTIFEKA